LNNKQKITKAEKYVLRFYPTATCFKFPRTGPMRVGYEIIDLDSGPLFSTLPIGFSVTSEKEAWINAKYELDQRMLRKFAL
jgi:hypothetical protein